MMKFMYSVTTHPGTIREKNEDNFRINDLWKKDTKVQKMNKHGKEKIDRFLAAVCDGMGGEKRGEIASLYSVESLRRRSLEEMPECFQTDVQQANEAILNIIRQNHGERSGSTLAAMYADKAMGYFVNLGDSRIYQFRNKVLKRLSKDQDRSQGLIEAGILTEEEAKHTRFSHELLQYLGIFPEETELHPQIIPAEMMMINDEYLICSDGLTDMVSDERIEEILLHEKSIDEQVRKLLGEALDNGGKDNITIILVKVF